MFGEDGEKGNCVTKTLQELIDMKWITYHLDGNHGGDYPRADEFVEAGIPYISANCIVGDRIDMKLAKYVTAERAKRFRKGIAENGDVLFAHNATVGPVAILETEEPTVILGTSLTSYRCNSNHILAEYLMAYMKNPLFVQQYERNMQQSTRKQVPITTQRKYSFIIPSMDEQKEFAHFVKQSDKSKFVRFKSQFIEMFGELDKNTKQFPVRKLNEISSYWNGLTYKPADAVKDGTGTLVLRSSNIQNGALAFEDNVYVNCEIKEKLFVQDNDILMCSRNGSAALVGKTALIKGLVEPTTFGAFMMIIRSEYYSYLRTYFETPFFRSQISTGTSTINQITGKMLNDISLPVPDMDTVRKFESFVHQSDKSKLKEEDHKSGMHEL